MLHRPLAVALALGVLAVSGVGSGTEPPSSLEPVVGQADVTISHLHRQTTGCYLHVEPSETKKDKRVCRAKRADADGGASVVLTPIPSSGQVLTGSDGRSRVEVALDDAKGTQRKTVTLTEGRWELRWSGHPKLERLEVVKGENFTVALRTISGDCEKTKKGTCRLASAAVSRSVTLPERYRAAR